MRLQLLHKPSHEVAVVLYGSDGGFGSLCGGSTNLTPPWHLASLRRIHADPTLPKEGGVLPLLSKASTLVGPYSRLLVHLPATSVAGCPHGGLLDNQHTGREAILMELFTTPPGIGWGASNLGWVCSGVTSAPMTRNEPHDEAAARGDQEQNMNVQLALPPALRPAGAGPWRGPGGASA
ncbi:hypothetical protein HaLaN_21216 [Haematococcus lacustris]|uniref:Uncharacterized protein n=1 Tax=Haematococcus lacustris TaxID=44745 RepID=A0A699ZNR5_HAELA|nr:hypothetical protein HaLaN_21216 [Haematococcus lacustris]